MTLVSYGPHWFPDFMHETNAVGAPAFNNNGTMNDSNDACAMIIRVPQTGTLHSFEFRTATVTTFPGNGLRLSFQSVDLTTGMPSGIVDQFRTITSTPGSNSWATPPGILSSDGTDGGSQRSVTVGDLLACVIDFLPTYTTGSLQIANVVQNTVGEAVGFPYNVVFETSWALVGLSFMPVLALRYDTGYVCVPYCLPISAINTHTFNTGSTPDEIALHFVPPVQMTVSGFRAHLDLDGDADIILYDTDGTTPLATSSMDKDVRAATTGVHFDGTFNATPTLTAGGTYRLAIKPTSATSLSAYSFDFASNARLNGMPGGSSISWDQQTDAGGWTPTTTRRPLICLRVIEVDDGTGSPPPPPPPPPAGTSMARVFLGM